MDSVETPETKGAERFLSPEVTEEILARLPVKSVLKFRCVSKSWRFSIDSRFFVNRRLRSSAELKVISNNTALDDPNKHLMKDSTVVGSCNGLLCILKQKSFFLWNPTTRISTELPKLDFQFLITKYGFGWDEGNDAYKVFVVVFEKGQKIGKVHSSLTNSWKTVEPGGSTSIYNPKGFFSCGHIHWLTENGHRIESFNLKSEVFRTTEQAFEPQRYMWLMETDGCLGVLSIDNDHTRFDAWVMKKYWVKESWVKQNTAPIPLEYKYNFNYAYALQDKGGINFYPVKLVQYYYVESLVSPRPVIEQEQVQGPF